MRRINYQRVGTPVLIVLGLLVTACGRSEARSANLPVTDLPSTTKAAIVTPDSNQLSTAAIAVPTIAVVATSRGPNLEATDPTTVKLDSGGLQLVEFFRFT